MTPLIDVMLVLLVIFMITAPLMTSSLKLDLPRADGAQPTGDAPRSSLSRSTATGSSSRRRGGRRAETLRARVAAGGADAIRRPRCSCAPTRPCPTADVAELIGMVQKAGLTRIGFVDRRAGDAAQRRRAATASIIRSSSPEPGAAP